MVPLYCVFQLLNPARPARLRTWDPESMTGAYIAVTESGMSVYKAAKSHGVPEQTLRDRVNRRISIDTVKSGPDPVLSLEEEARLVSHIKELAEVGYGYTRSEVTNLATDYAVAIGKRRKEQPFSLKWFYTFMNRWPELKVIKPSSLSEQRARCANKMSISNYFEELNRIMRKYDLLDKPQCIYNIDEKGINTEYNPPKIVAGRECRPQAVVAERGKTVTVLGAGNALGHQIPPYFVFPGERLTEQLLDGKSVGADGTMSTSGWSNTDIFRKYLKEHFIKYCQGRSSTDHMLVLYDGHGSHIGLDLVDWADDNKIILFVLPPHTSHILQPMDVGCFGPFQLLYSKECTKFARTNHRMVTKYDVCNLACKAYSSALSPSNLQNSFKKAGIYPTQSAVSMVEFLSDAIKPSTLYEVDPSTEVTTPKPTVEATEIHQDVVENFFNDKGGKVAAKVTKKRRSIHKVVGGKALEGETVTKMKEYLSATASNKRRKSSKTQSTKKAPGSRTKSRPKTSGRKRTGQSQPTSVVDSQIPGPSRSHIDVPESLPEDSQDDEVCCQCEQWSPPGLKQCPNLQIVNWACCDKCKHWVHLKFCVALWAIEPNDKFICPCCTLEEE